MKAFRRIASGTSAAVLTLSSLMSLGFTGVAHAAAGSDTCTWTGAGGNSNFSTAGNWSNCSGAAPVNGDSLVFDNTGLTTQTTLNDDISSLSVGGITFQGSNSGFNGYTLNGDGFTLLTSINVNSSSAFDVISNDITLGGSVLISGSSGAFLQLSNQTPATLNLNNHTLTLGIQTAVADNITGSGTIVVNNSTSYLQGDNSAWTGQLQLNTDLTVYGTKVLNNSGITVTIPSGQSLITVVNGGTIPANIVVGGAGDPAFGAALISETDMGDPSADVTYSGTVTLTANTIADPGTGTTTISGPLQGNYTLTAMSGTQGKLVIDSSNNTSGSPNGTTQAQSQTITVAAGDNQPNQSVDVGNLQTYVIDGQRGGTTVENGGILKGDGQVDSLVALKGGTVAPGHSPGKLTVVRTMTLMDGSTYQAELKDKTAGDFDQIVVGSASDTTGNDVQLGSSSTGGANLDVQLYSGANIKAGDTFEIINNLSQTPVLNTFAGLPEGATFKVGNGTMKITYKGGDGNDVVLTAMSNISAPDTGFAVVAAHPALTLGVSAAAALTIFGLARKNSRKLAPARAKASRSKR